MVGRCRLDDNVRPLETVGLVASTTASMVVPTTLTDAAVVGVEVTAVTRGRLDPGTRTGRATVVGMAALVGEGVTRCDEPWPAHEARASAISRPTRSDAIAARTTPTVPRPGIRTQAHVINRTSRPAGTSSDSVEWTGNRAKTPDRKRGMIEVLKVSSRSNPNAVAGALAGVVRSAGVV